MLYKMSVELAEMDLLQAEKQRLMTDSKKYKKQGKEAKLLLKYLMKNEEIKQFQEEIFLDFVDEMIIHSRDEITFILRCGLQLRERLVN